MLLSARLLNNVQNVNAFEVVSQAQWTDGDALTLYFQLVDQSLDQGNKPAYRRYMPPAGSTLQVVLDNVDDAKRVTKNATQPYSQDPSIWSVSILAADKCRGTVNLKLTLTEPTKTLRGVVLAACLVQSQTTT